MNFQEFQRELAAGKIHPAYCFMGDEDYLVAEGARAVIAAVLPGPEREFCQCELGPESGPEDVRRALRSSSFFGSRRVVRLHGLGRISAETQDALAANVAKIPPGTHLVALGGPDKRRKNSKDLLAAMAVVDCPPLKRGEAVAWARERARQAGLALGLEAAQALVDGVGPSLGMIATEIEKAAVYLGGERSELTAADLAVLTGREREDDVFALVEAAAGGRAEDALRILEDLLTLGEPEPVLLALLARQVRQILLAGHLAAAGKRVPEIAGVLGVPPFVAEKILRQTGRLPFARCRTLLERMLLADVRGKTGERDPRVELELVVLEMAGRM